MSPRGFAAQIRGVDPLDHFGEREPLLPSPPYEPPQPREILPQPAAPPPEPPAPGTRGPHVFVRAYRFVGNTVFSANELAAVAAPYLDREVDFEDLESLRYAVTAFYINHGYVNSGAVIPDQRVTDGVIAVRIIEGRLTQVGITGNRWFRSGYLRERIERYAQGPLNVNELRAGLQILDQDERIRRVNAALKPGLLPGEAVLRVQVEEEVPYQLGLTFDNYESPTIGAEHGTFSVADDNLLGYGDTLSALYGITDGLDEVDANYTAPVSPCDTRMEARYRYSHSHVVEAPFEPLDIDSRFDHYGIGVVQPVYRALTGWLSLSLTGEHRDTATFLLGQPFSFSPGAHDGRSVVNVLRFAQEWIDRSAVQVLAARSQFSFGLPIFGATANAGPLPEGRFFAWLGQFQWARRMTRWNIETVGRLDLQLTPDRLLSLEQFSVGGVYSVRGYRENQVVRDNGAVGSVEVRVPVLQTWQGFVLQLAAFGDVGAAWAAHGTTPAPPYLASVGVGTRWLATPRVQSSVYWGQKLRDVTTPGGDLQDAGVYVQLTVGFGLPVALAERLEPWRGTVSVGDVP